jgi:hypothetical protein
MTKPVSIRRFRDASPAEKLTRRPVVVRFGLDQACAVAKVTSTSVWCLL